jgi:hypothetical protein
MNHVTFLFMLQPQHLLMMAILIIFLAWKILEPGHQQRLKREEDFMRSARKVEAAIMAADRHNQTQGWQVYLMLEKLLFTAFSRSTRRAVEQLEILWKSKFAV